MIRIKVVNSSKATGAIAARWQAKAGVEPPFAGRWKLFFLGARIFYKVIFRCNCSPGTVARHSFAAKVSQGGAVLFAASKSFRFSHHPLRVPKAWHRKFAACGQRSGLLALNLASIFEKLLDQKTFCFCAPHRWSNLFFILQIPPTIGSHSALFHVKQCSWKNNCVRFAESLRCLPLCCSPVVVLSELLLNVS